MSNCQSSYRRTIAAALAMFSLATLIAIASSIWMSASFAFLGPITILFSAFWLAVATVAGLVAVGGLIGLSRDTMELSGQPYYSKRPRECAAGAFVHLRRRLLSMLPGRRLDCGSGRASGLRSDPSRKSRRHSMTKVGWTVCRSRPRCCATAENVTVCFDESKNPPLFRCYGASPAAFAGCSVIG